MLLQSVWLTFLSDSSSSLLSLVLACSMDASCFSSAVNFCFLESLALLSVCICFSASVLALRMSSSVADSRFLKLCYTHIKNKLNLSLMVHIRVVQKCSCFRYHHVLLSYSSYTCNVLIISFFCITSVSLSSRAAESSCSRRSITIWLCLSCAATCLVD